ncbi:hypothetical protein H9L17_02830 [Thermomonas brevis]|uniref:SGNH/GDSL hydrolase family protein n=1 Tax=Thermomonas brevis TaxID=215691 RepID=A0A7G9QUT9_9GAMM|nr:hypothetical protein [Thermomonas brevis]QNN47114.1 hypothetical protein H9L17_02830 [Thermomonas brevis]
MRALASLLAALLCLAGCGTKAPADGKHERVLFVGNSLTYVGNLPAVFAAMANANGHAIESDMIVRGGASLTEPLKDGSIARALDGRRYAALVLQERGGDLLCGFGPESCADSSASLKAIARMAKEKGVASVVLLGTYQSMPSVSKVIVEREGAAADEAGIAYVEVSQTLQRLGGAQPALVWFDADGMHPGKDLTLLEAMLLHRQLFGALPAAQALVVDGPIYGVQSGLTGTLRAADAPAPKADTPRSIAYSADTTRSLLDALSADR